MIGKKISRMTKTTFNFVQHSEDVGNQIGTFGVEIILLFAKLKVETFIELIYFVFMQIS